MRDISELHEIMDEFNVPPDVRDAIEIEDVSSSVYYFWVALFISAVVSGMLLLFVASTGTVFPPDAMQACIDRGPIAPVFVILPVMISAIPVAGILVAYLNLACARKHWISMFCFGFLNEQNHPYVRRFIKELNRRRRPDHRPDAYIRHALAIWIPWAWLAFAAFLIIGIIGLVWTNAVC